MPDGGSWSPPFSKSFNHRSNNFTRKFPYFSAVREYGAACNGLAGSVSTMGINCIQVSPTLCNSCATPPIIGRIICDAAHRIDCNALLQQHFSLLLHHRPGFLLAFVDPVPVVNMFGTIQREPDQPIVISKNFAHSLSSKVPLV